MKIIREVSYDVVVCGAGCAGFTAAVQSARAGARTLLLEKYGVGGGIMTILGNPFVALFHTGTRQIIRGIGWEYVTRLADEGHAVIPDFTPTLPHSVMGAEINIPAGAEMIDRMLCESGADVWYNTPVVDAETTGRHVDAVIVSTKRGLCRVSAKQYIDCTGDGDVAAWCGAKLLDEGAVQPGTLRYYFGTGEADDKSIAMLNTAEFDAEVSHGTLNTEDVWSRGHYQGIYNENGNNINHVDMAGWDEPQKGSLCQMDGRRSILRTMKWLERIGGMPRITAIAPETAPRETRRIRCDTVITGEDYVTARRRDDDICYAYYPVDIHRLGADSLDCRQIDKDNPPSVPFSALICANTDNLLVAGRMISADREAHSGLRVKAVCMACGQAAGMAAALTRDMPSVRDIDMRVLKKALADNDCIVP